MDAIRSTGPWVITFVVAMSGVLVWPSQERQMQHAPELPACCFGPGQPTDAARQDRVDLAELDRRVDETLHRHSQCEGTSERVRLAKARLRELRRDKAVLERRILELKTTMERPRRRIVISAACLDNPLAKGCM